MTRLLLALIALIALLALGDAAHADPRALWKIISEKCVPNEREYGQPAPCSVIDRAKGYVVLKDLVGDTQYLLMPTVQVSGIEDPAVLAPNAPNYFADAWAERHFTIEAAKRDLPRDNLSLAVNSVYGRTQTQLHIHIDCLTIAAHDAIANNIAAIGDQWARFPVKLNGHHYRAMRVAGETLDGVDPFRLVADGIPGASKAMDRQTVVVVGATLPGGTPGFVLLDSEANVAAGDYGSGEELQDHSCALARQ
jgi:CDP-diacylglycerol pyrophosphatase